MKSFTVEEAENNFSSVLSIVRGGEEVAVTSRKKTVARVVPVVAVTNGTHGAVAIKRRKSAWAEHFISSEPSTAASPRPANPPARSSSKAGDEGVLRPQRAG